MLIHAPLRSPPALCSLLPLLPRLLAAAALQRHVNARYLCALRLPLRFAANHARPLTPLANPEEQAA